MNDPWDVKAVRWGHQYESCMKLNGVPLLPPVLSKECRKEMQYYKLLAKEVEKRISFLKPYINPDSDADLTDTPDITNDAYQSPKYSPRHENRKEMLLDSPKCNNKYNSKLSVQNAHILLDENDKISEQRDEYNSIRSPRQSPLPEDDEVPQRDCDCQNKNEKKEVLTDLETDKSRTTTEPVHSNMNDFNISDKEDCVSLPYDGPPSISTKSYSGSLNDICADSSKESQEPQLVRQRSYTVLQPSPQLLAHLEVHSISTGVDVNSISMSESQVHQESNKKRKSWDLESAKVKWSSMAMELKTKSFIPKNNTSNDVESKIVIKTPTSLAEKPNSAKEKVKKNTIVKSSPASEPIPPRTNGGPRNGQCSVSVAGRTPSKGSSSPSRKTPKRSDQIEVEVKSPKQLMSELDDPTERVKELYEKLQKQQVLQMASLMEKQKKEQQLLQQVFEEQNNILFKQLKTVCPKASFEVRQAWGDVKDNNDRGPVSLSQLMNTSTPIPSEPTSPVSPVSKTLTESNRCINKCDDMLKKSRTITRTIQKPTVSPTKNGSSSPNRTRGNSQRSNGNSGSKPNSPKNKHIARKLQYDNRKTDESETLTDHSNDTLADLNVTFPSDNSDGNLNLTQYRKMCIARACSPMSSDTTLASVHHTEGAIKDLENIIQSSMNSLSRQASPKMKNGILYRPPTTKEREAATKIVAYAKGYLVRRLMRTERVQAIVQTIRDALLCALQLHQDRDGIRGADVDLHRRLIQQITSACYMLHDTFVTNTPTERCAVIAADRSRKQALANKQLVPRRSVECSRRESEVSLRADGAAQ